MKKIVLRVLIMCAKCKTGIMKVIAKFDGIKSMAIDAEKGIVTLICETDPVQIVQKLRKAGKFAEVVSVGPEKEDKIKNEDKDVQKDDKKICKPGLPSCCDTCRPSYIVFYEEHPYGCAIV